MGTKCVHKNTSNEKYDNFQLHDSPSIYFHAFNIFVPFEIDLVKPQKSERMFEKKIWLRSWTTSKKLKLTVFLDQRFPTGLKERQNMLF